jgi:hypothetical protein
MVEMNNEKRCKSEKCKSAEKTRSPPLEYEKDDE